MAALEEIQVSMLVDGKERDLNPYTSNIRIRRS